MNDESPEFVEPTAENRRNFAIRWLTAGLVLALACVLGKIGFASLGSLPDCDRLPYIRMMMVAFVGLPFILGVYVFRLGRKTLSTQRWVPPTPPMFFRQRIGKGRKARWIAYYLLAAGVVNMTAPIWGGYLLYRSGLFSPPAKESACGRSQIPQTTKESF
ncbi:MAG: hypothetical protein J0I77_00405 [Rudaea sp.]|nr:MULTISPECIES: hypothetical protein [unclassified Rudaea]MBN8884153.1 hypothetical protein [Rudaea sp.]MBR0347363.1 hypothetical protein [Rudaea sp.]